LGDRRIAVEVQRVSKVFPGVRALSDVSCDFRSGEVHALLGENGAGKSTLIKIIAGVYQPSSGTVSIRGTPVTQFTPYMARTAGVATVFQELSLAPDLTVEQNIFLGAEPTRLAALGWIDGLSQRRRAMQVLETVGADVDPQIRLSALGAAQQQLVEIAKAIWTDPAVLILDEPTDKLFGEEQLRLFDLIRRLRERGIAIIYISHKLEEIHQIADRVTILRDGTLVDTTSVGEVTIDDMIRKMAGRKLGDLFPKISADPGPEVLRLEKISSAGFLEDVSLTLHRGEVLGVMGLVGAGRTLLAKTITGVVRPTGGRILVHNRPARIDSPGAAVSMGFGFLPEDRRTQGLIVMLPVRENIVLASLSRWLINHRQLNDMSRRYFERLEIKAPSIHVPVSTLSGGNQQKVVLARWLCSKAKVFIFDEPTQGIDVATKVEIYNLINELTAQGAGIIMISSDMREILGMSDRIVVMRKGRVVSEYRRDDATPERILADALAGNSDSSSGFGRDNQEVRTNNVG